MQPHTAHTMLIFFFPCLCVLPITAYATIMPFQGPPTHPNSKPLITKMPCSLSFVPKTGMLCLLRKQSMPFFGAFLCGFERYFGPFCPILAVVTPLKGGFGGKFGQF